MPKSKLILFILISFLSLLIYGNAQAIDPQIPTFLVFDTNNIIYWETKGGIASGIQHIVIGELSWEQEIFSGATSIGDYIGFDFEINPLEVGNYNVTGWFGQFADYGIFQLKIDDIDIGLPQDFYVNNFVNVNYDLENVNVLKSFGNIFLSQGSHNLKLIVTGTNQNSVDYAGGGRYHLGIESIIFINTDTTTTTTTTTAL